MFVQDIAEAFTQTDIVSVHRFNQNYSEPDWGAREENSQESPTVIVFISVISSW